MHEQGNSDDDVDDLDRQKLVKKTQQLSKKSLKLQENIRTSLTELTQKAFIEDPWKTKFKRLLKKYRRERDEKEAYEAFIQQQNKKVKVLAEHVDKLMKALKIENNKKIQVLAQFGHHKKEYKQLELKSDKLSRVCAAQLRFDLCWFLVIFFCCLIENDSTE